MTEFRIGDDVGDVVANLEAQADAPNAEVTAGADVGGHVVRRVDLEVPIVVATRTRARPCKGLNVIRWPAIDRGARTSAPTSYVKTSSLASLTEARWRLRAQPIVALNASVGRMAYDT